MDLLQTMQNVDNWMKQNHQNHLKLNPDKMEFIIFTSKLLQCKCISDGLIITGTRGEHTPCVKHLGVLMVNYLRIKALCPYLSKVTAQILTQSLVISHLDYCNVCFIGLPDTDLRKLQHIQNLCAKLVLGAGPRDSTMDFLQELHWLLVRYRIQYKVLCLVFKSLHGMAPQYLQELFQKHQLKGCRHDKDNVQLVVPFTVLKTFADWTPCISSKILELNGQGPSCYPGVIQCVQCI